MKKESTVRKNKGEDMKQTKENPVPWYLQDLIYGPHIYQPSPGFLAYVTC
jgi:hypothetical protein